MQFYTFANAYSQRCDRKRMNGINIFEFYCDIEEKKTMQLRLFCIPLSIQYLERKEAFFCCWLFEMFQFDREKKKIFFILYLKDYDVSVHSDQV